MTFWKYDIQDTRQTKKEWSNKDLYENQCNLSNGAISTFLDAVMYIPIINYVSGDFDGIQKLKVTLCPNEVL